MDVASTTLSQFCLAVARSELSQIPLEHQQGDDHKYYFRDRRGRDGNGDSSFHRLMALHAPPAAIVNFLRHMAAHQRELILSDSDDDSEGDTAYSDLPDPLSLLSQDDRGCTPLHVAVHRNSWQVDVATRMILEKFPVLASVPMHCGSYPLHVAMGHSMTIHPAVVDALVRADPSVCWREDCRGDTPLSLLWKNVLRFRWARQWEVDGIVPCRIESSGDLSWMTMIAPDQFRDYALRLVHPFADGCAVTWHTVCGTPRCPPLLVRLLLEPDQSGYVKGGLYDRDDRGRLPLHCAAGAASVTCDFLPDSVRRGAPTVLELLLDAAPSAASSPDASGSLPLHYALRRSSDLPIESDLIALIQAYPDALRFPDPVTNLYPAQQLASRLTGDYDGKECFHDVLYCMIVDSPEAVFGSGRRGE